MPELLLELFSEEIPARIQRGAARDLGRMAGEWLSRAELPFERIRSFAGPRRLTLAVDGIPPRQADRVEERKGPRVGAPEAAVAGFFRSAGVEREQATQRDGVWFVNIARPGRRASEVIAEIVPAIITAFPWPKSMTWGEETLRWVRPLHRILCVFDGRPIPFRVGGIETGEESEGHRFMTDGRPFRARHFAEYRSALASRFVVLDAEDRKRRIVEGARSLCAERGLALVEDEGLLEEVAGMAEWPTPLLGDMDPRFLVLPSEVIQTSMRAHQRYFAVVDQSGKLAPHFVVVANIGAADGGSLIAAGNARVLSARLSDAQFFWSEDLKRSLESRVESLKGVTFHARLGTLFERAGRIEALARAIGPALGADPGRAALAARLAKADLTTAMVGEFPELQGIMGGHYARAEGMAADIAEAIRDHYRPQGPADWTPSAPVSMAVALADKMDSILAFFSIGETPTGSRDPFALRRAALGVIRILLDSGARLPLGEMIAGSGFSGEGVLPFFAERLKVSLRERGARHDLVDAVFALGDDDLVRVVARIEALAEFLATEDGADLLAADKRAGNILTAEARKGPLPTTAPCRPQEPVEEVALFDALVSCRPRVTSALAKEDFSATLGALAGLRGPVDAFFEAALVNSPIAAQRENRLSLLAEVRAIMGQVADLSLVSG